MALIAEVAVNGTAYSFDTLFSYSLPENMRISAGCRVLVPFGRGNQRKIGVVMRTTEGDTSKLKKIIARIDSEPVVSAEQLEIAEYLHEHTFCTYFDAVKAMLPPALGIKAKENFSLVKNFADFALLSAESRNLLEALKLFDSDIMMTEFIANYITENGRR